MYVLSPVHATVHISSDGQQTIDIANIRRRKNIYTNAALSRQEKHQTEARVRGEV
jgi:hypothetical protein